MPYITGDVYGVLPLNESDWIMKAFALTVYVNGEPLLDDSGVNFRLPDAEPEMTSDKCLKLLDFRKIPFCDQPYFAGVSVRHSCVKNRVFLI